MKYFSLFSGVGGFELGIGDKGECIGFSEIDKYANQVLKYRFPKTKNYGDIKNINWSDVPDFDLLVGGSPCQDLSVAGKQKGLSGERSGLFFEYIRCLKEKQPAMFIWENVKGALSSSNGWDFTRVQIEMAEVGYDLQWQVLNAKDFGVPQNRERVFAIGHLRGTSAREVFFKRGSRPENIVENDTDEIYGETKKLSDAFRTRNTSGASATLKGLGGGLGAKTGLYAIPLKFLDRNQKNYQGDYSFAVDTVNSGGVMKDCRIRRLTPTECERLMSWPDSWTKYGINDKGETIEISDSQRYKMCGNGVVSKVVETIVKNLK